MQGVPHRHLHEQPAVQISYTNIRGATQLAEARERVRTCACSLMTFFIILLVLSIIGLFSKIAELPDTFEHNEDYVSWCRDNTKDNKDHCQILGILNFVTIMCFVLDLISRVVSIFFYSWGIRATSVKRAVHAASLYRVFWFQLCILGVLSLVQLILIFYAYQLVYEGIEQSARDNEGEEQDFPNFAIYMRFGMVLFVAFFIIIFASVCACVGCCVHSFKRRTAIYESMIQNNQQAPQIQGSQIMQGQVIGAVPVSYVYHQPHN